MPGRVLVVDPVMQNRITLKAALARAYFTVHSCGELEEVARAAIEAAPDVALLSMEFARAHDFRQIECLRALPDLAHVPVVLMVEERPSSEDWRLCCAHLADEVLRYGTPRELLVERLKQLIRMKQKIDAMRARQKALGDMGFAEHVAPYPPPFQRPGRVDFSASGLPPALCAEAARLAEQRSADPGEAADVVVLSADALPRGEAVRRLARLRDAGLAAPPAILFIDTAVRASRAVAALELGADVVIAPPVAAEELATRLRRLAWTRAYEARAEARMARHLREALEDPLTGLFNRRYALLELKRLAAAADSGTPLAVLMLDLDNFKQINDRLGHAAGDAALKECARRLRKEVGEAGLLARIGGEEFLVALRAETPDALADLAERLRGAIASSPLAIGQDRWVNASVSIGVAIAAGEMSHRGDQEALFLMERADGALRAAKLAGRNRVRFAGEGLLPRTGT